LASFNNPVMLYHLPRRVDATKTMPVPEDQDQDQERDIGQNGKGVVPAFLAHN
jgi:hypothetical protein